jgi:hypothetical protein
LFCPFLTPSIGAQAIEETAMLSNQHDGNPFTKIDLGQFYLSQLSPLDALLEELTSQTRTRKKKAANRLRKVQSANFMQRAVIHIGEFLREESAA